MFNISLPVADFIFSFSNLILILGAVLVAVGTFGSIWSGGIRERYSDERISVNEANAAKAMENAAVANENTEKLRESNLTLQAAADRERAARLLLEKKIAPRHLTEHQKTALIAALKPFHGQKISILCLQEEETLQFAKDISKILSESGWVKSGTGINQIAAYSNMTLARGVGVMLRDDKELLPENIYKGNEVLGDALTSLGIAEKKFLLGLPFDREDKVWLWVGRKPD